jgi:hypothetical protein
MGGKITVNVAGIDKRVKAAVPSCGGTGSASGKLSGMSGSGLKSDFKGIAENTIDDLAYIPRVMCPILFQSPSNDFAGPMDNMTENWKKIGSRVVAYTIAPHLNHRSIAETDICGILWFDQHLKKAFSFPKTPELSVNLKTANGVPAVSMKTDRPAEVVKVDIYYSIDPHCLTRFWRDAEAKKIGDVWTADCPVLSTAQPLYVYANVSYALKTERVGYRGSKPPASFTISSKEAMYFPEELKEAGVKATDKPTRMIDDFARGWHDWYRLEWGNPHVWNATTRKLKDPKWRGPADAKLVFDVKCPKDNTIVVIADLNQWGVYPEKPGGSYLAGKTLKGSPDWQTVSIGLEEMMPAKKDCPPAMTTWDTVTELSFRSRGTFLQDGKEVKFGEASPGWSEPREFRNLRWEGGVENTAKKFSIASRMYTVEPNELKAAGIKPTELHSNIIEDFGKNWQKKRYTFNYSGQWPYRCRKLRDSKWQAPSASAKLALDVKCSKSNNLAIELDDYRAQILLRGTSQWETVVLSPEDFKLREQKDPKKDKEKKPQKLQQWTAVNEVVIAPGETVNPGQSEVEVGEGWQGPLPEFRNLRWVEITANGF